MDRARTPLDAAHDRCRRRVLSLGAALVATVVVRPARAAAPDLAAAIASFTGGMPAPEGGVTIEIASLVENGNAVPVTIAAAPSSPDVRVTGLALFNEKNPERDVVRARFGPAAGGARLSTRIRLATSQKLVAVAQQSDGTFRSATVDVVVTLAACIEGEP